MHCTHFNGPMSHMDACDDLFEWLANKAARPYERNLDCLILTIPDISGASKANADLHSPNTERVNHKYKASHLHWLSEVHFFKSPYSTII